MRLLQRSVLAMFLSITAAGAQSLDPKKPDALQSGINKSVVDNSVGPQYWYLTGGPGSVRIHAQFAARGVYNNGPATITLKLTDSAKTWSTAKSITASQKPMECDLTGQLKQPTKLLLSIAPPPAGLLKAGGEYQIEATGAVAFGPASTDDPVVGIYKHMNGYTSRLGDCKFLADGTIQTTSGATGTWKLFDKDSQTYVIDMSGQERCSLQFMSGRGLLNGDSIIFQRIR
jgi:hypothetical protein